MPSLVTCVRLTFAACCLKKKLSNAMPDYAVKESLWWLSVFIRTGVNRRGALGETWEDWCHWCHWSPQPTERENFCSQGNLDCRLGEVDASADDDNSRSIYKKWFYVAYRRCHPGDVHFTSPKLTDRGWWDKCSVLHMVREVITTHTERLQRLCPTYSTLYPWTHYELKL